MKKQLFFLSALSVLILSSCNPSSPKKRKSSSLEPTSTSATDYSTSGTSLPHSSSSQTSVITSSSATRTSDTSITPKPKILVNIEVSGYKSVFALNEEFYFGGIVTANFSDSSTDNVTNESNFSGFDSSTLGLKKITVSYTYLNETKYCYYNIEIIEKQTDLGKQKISYILNYINEHSLELNESKIGIDETTKVTFEGVALEKFDLVKTTKKFGLDLSHRYKVLLGDETGIIAAASNGASGSLYDKVSDYAGKDTSKYTITGHLSVYLGHPEIIVDTCTYNQDLNVNCDPEVISKGKINLSEFYNLAKTNFYNCAGHGYGDIYTVKGLTCYKYESDGQHQKFYYFTDGQQYLKAIAQNVSASISEGNSYDITGTISLKNYGAAIRLLTAKKSTDAIVQPSDYVYREMNMTNLRVSLNAPQDDTMTRYEDLTINKSYFYKFNSYLTAIEKSGKFYVSLADGYYGNTYIADGSLYDTAEHYKKYAIGKIGNDNFWNVTEDEMSRFNPFYEDYINEDNTIELGYTAELFEFKSGRIFWKVILLPNFIN